MDHAAVHTRAVLRRCLCRVLNTTQRDIEALVADSLSQHPECSSGMLTISLYLSPTTFVVGGSIALTETFKRMCAQKHLSPQMVRVHSAFHTEWMAPAEDELREALQSAAITSPRVPIICNVDGVVLDAATPPDELRRRLLVQLTCPVRWGATVETIASRDWFGANGGDVDPVEQQLTVGALEVLVGKGSALRRFVASCFETYPEATRARFVVSSIGGAPRAPLPPSQSE